MRQDVFSDYYLERYVLGELPDEYAEEIRRRASADPAFRAALEDIKSSNRDILKRYPASFVKATLLERLGETPGRPEKEWSIPFHPRRRILYISSAFAAAMLLLILILPGIKKQGALKPSATEQDFSLVKGPQNIDLSKTQLLIYRKDDGQVEILEDGKHARAGDLLQLAYVAAQDPYGVILSIDGRGRVSLHFPVEKSGSTDLMLHKKILLPNAIELDDAPSFERFFLLTSGSPIDVGEVLKTAENLARDPARAERAELDLKEGIRQYSFLIIKGEGS